MALPSGATAVEFCRATSRPDRVRMIDAVSGMPAPEPRAGDAVPRRRRLVMVCARLRPDPEVIARHAAKIRGRNLSPEHKAKMAAGQRGSPSRAWPPTRRRLMQEDPAFYRRWYEAAFSPEAKAKQSAAISRAQRGRPRLLSGDQKAGDV